MTLVLDTRQRAMLAEMGLRTWGPESLRPSVPAAAPVAAGTAAAPAARAPIPSDPTPSAAARREEPRYPVEAPPAAATVREAAVPTPARAAGDAAPPSWQALREAVTGCTACGLCEGRRNGVPGAGDLQADWLVVGEGPGEGEDLVGTPFAGQEGLLLDAMLRAIGLDRRSNVYLTHALKCRAPANRSPEAEEVARCEQHLRREVELLQPRVILALGRQAVQALLPGSEPLGKLRGRVHDYRDVPVVVSYAPGYLLRNLPEKARAWADLCLAQDVLARQPARAAR